MVDVHEAMDGEPRGPLAVVIPATTILAPFAEVAQLMRAVARIIASGAGATTVEYIDDRTMRAVEQDSEVRLGIAAEARDRARAYLAVVTEGQPARRLEDEVRELAAQLAGLGALDVCILPADAGRALIQAREKASRLGQGGIRDFVDVVVPRAAICDFMTAASRIAAARLAHVGGCGHGGDGSIHLSVYEDPDERTLLIHDLLKAGIELGGAISSEHGIGTPEPGWHPESRGHVRHE